MSVHQFSCAECGGIVSLATGAGRTMEYWRGVPEMPVPDDMAILTCAKCGETYTTPDIEDELAIVLGAAFRAWQSEHLGAVVHRIELRHLATRRQVAGVAGVTRQHLDQVLAGEVEASVTLHRLLESYDANPTECGRHLVGKTYAECYPWRVRQ